MTGPMCMEAMGKQDKQKRTNKIFSSVEALKILDTWFMDSKTCSGRPHCVIKDCDLCMVCFEDLRNRFK